MYKVYGGTASRAFRVLWMLEEIGEPYEVIPAKAQSDEIRAVNPSGKIPAMADGEHLLTDSVAIMTYLADRHGQLTYPAGTIDRAHQDALIHMLNDEFDSVLWTAARLNGRVPEELRVPQVIPTLHWEFARNLDRLAERFEGPFLQGERMTVADILAVHCLNWAVLARFPVENETLRGYAKSLSEREAYVRARARGL